MEISGDARERLDHRVARIMRDIDVYESDREEITRELTSHFYDHSMTHARERGASAIEKQDVEAVLAESEDPKETAAAYMSAYVSSLHRAGIVSRSIAFVLDLIIFVVCLLPLVFLVTLPLLIIFPGQLILHTGPGAVRVDFRTEMVQSLFIAVTGFIMLVATIFYFVVLEGRFGATPGKWLMGLRVLKENGTRIGYVEAILRNLPKIIGQSALLLLDALIMVLIFRKEKQRGFDKIARTIVVHRKKASKEAR